MSVADGSLLRFEDEAALRATGWDIARAVRLSGLGTSRRRSAWGNPWSIAVRKRTVATRRYPPALVAARPFSPRPADAIQQRRLRASHQSKRAPGITLQESASDNASNCLWLFLRWAAGRFSLCAWWLRPKWSNIAHGFHMCTKFQRSVMQYTKFRSLKKT